MKTEMCLFEGAYATYHLNDKERAKSILKKLLKPVRMCLLAIP